MTLRLVQAGEGTPRPIVIAFLVGPHVDAKMREALGPTVAIVADDSATGTEGTVQILGKFGLTAFIGSDTTLAGWSQGGARVRDLYAGGSRPRNIIVCDSTHARWPITPADPTLRKWQALADAGRRGDCRVVMTCSSMRYTKDLPRTADSGPFAPTLDVVRAITGWPLTESLDGMMAGGLVAIKFPSDNIDAAAHIRQQTIVLSQLFRHYVRPGAEAEFEPEAAHYAVATAVEETVCGVDFGCAVLNAAIAYLTVRETSHNSSDVIDAMLREVGVGPGNEWCAAFITRCLRDAEKATGRMPLLKGSAGAQAIVRQLRDAGMFIEAGPDCRPQAGDIMAWTRGGWKGHIGVVESWDGPSGWVIEGNSGERGDMVARMPERLDNPNLLGIGRLP